jgi:acyl-CoA synthetase (AMP-forming)/AMP-acid ligase II
MIIRGGENIFPKEIEDYLNTHECIAEAHVVSYKSPLLITSNNLIFNYFQIGIPDKRMGEEVGAFIRLKDNSKTLNHNDIKAFCRDNLAHFKIPKFTFIVEDFPRTSSGKIQKYKFLEVFADKLEQQLK